MSKQYISCETLSDWFDDYNADKSDWIISEIIENLSQGLTETNILLVDTTDKEDSEKLRTINNAIVSAVRDLKKLSKEVTGLIANGEVLSQGCGKKKGGAA